MNKLSERDIFEIAFKMLELILLVGIVLLLIKTKNMNNRLKDLERDYKIYELNLQNLEENKDVQFER